MNKEYMQRIAGIKSVGQLNESIGGYVDLKPVREAEVEESFDKDMSDIALDYSNNNPNTPPGAKAGELPKKNEGEDPDDTDDVNPFPSIVKEKEYADDEDGDWDSFDDDFNEDDRFAELGGKEMDSIIKNLMDSGFTAKDIVQYVVDKASAFKSFKKEDASEVPDASGEADEELTPSGEYDWDV